MTEYAQSTLQNSKNSNTIHDILDQDPQYFQSINKSLPSDILAELSQVLMQQREQLKMDKNKVLEKVNDLETQLEHQRTQLSGMKQYIKTLEDQCEGLRNMMSHRDLENEKRYAQLSETSKSMIIEMNEELSKERETNFELKNLLKQIQVKELEIRKLTITIKKLNQENESLKQLKIWNVRKSQQLNEAQLKLAQSKEAYQKLREENECLIERVNGLEEKIEELEYIATNQMTKVKEIMSQDLEKREADTKQRQNVELMREVQNNFETDFFAESINENSRKKGKGQVNRNNSQDFESSLDNVSEHWDKISLREIQASSKSKAFGDNIFGVDEMGDKVKPFESTKKIKDQPSIIPEKVKLFKEKQEDLSLECQFPLSIDRNKMETALKQKGSLNINVPQVLIEESPFQRIVQSEVQDNFFTPEADPLLPIHKRTKTNTDFKFNQGNREKQLDLLHKRLEQYKRANSDLEGKLERLESRLQEQVNAFQEEAFFQINTIERLTNELKEEKLANMEEQRKRDEKYNLDLLTVAGKCQEYEKKAEELSLTAEKEKKAAELFYQRLTEVEEQRWQLKQSAIRREEFGIQTDLKRLQFHLALNSWIPNLKEKQDKGTLTLLPQLNCVLTQTDLSQTVSNGFNTIHSYVPWAKWQQDCEVQCCPSLNSIGVGQEFFKVVHERGTETSSPKQKLTIHMIQPIQVEATRKQMKKEKQKRKKKEQNWPIKQFIPTPIAQQFMQSSMKNGEKQTDKTLYYSFQQQPEASYGNRQITLDLLKLNIILTALKKDFRSLGAAPNLNNVKISSTYKLNDIILKYKENFKYYFVLYALFRKGSELLADRLLLWREGIISTYLGTGLAMTGTKKYIYDPANFVMGNSEIILDRACQSIEVRRTGKKNYFTGEIEDCSWRVLSVEAFGQY